MVRFRGRSGSVNHPMLTGDSPPTTHRIAACLSHARIALWTCGVHTAGAPSSHSKPAPVNDHSIEPKQAALCEDVTYDFAHAGHPEARWKCLE